MLCTEADRLTGRVVQRRKYNLLLVSPGEPFVEGNQTERHLTGLRSIDMLAELFLVYPDELIECFVSDTHETSMNDSGESR